jgi:regulatory protein
VSGATDTLFGPALAPRDTDDESYRAAMQRAGRLLATRSRSEHEVRTRLAGAGYEAGVVDRVVDRLLELRLLDDLGFARQWVAERSTTRGPRLLCEELRGKGVAQDVIETALDAARLDEARAAAEQAARWSRKVVGRPLAEQARRLQTMLLRRGFSYEAVDGAVRSVLPPEGWD